MDAYDFFGASSMAVIEADSISKAEDLESK